MLRGAFVALAVLSLVSMPLASAGTQADPELHDAKGDVTRWPGVPTNEPSLDMLGLWFEEAPGELLVHLEVDAYAIVPEVSNIQGNPIVSAYIFVNGEGPQTPCSGYGKLWLQFYETTTDARSHLAIMSGDVVDNTCPTSAQHELVTRPVVDDIITWSIPKDLIPMVLPGDALSFARVDVYSGSTWPATPSDKAEGLPGRDFVLAEAPAGEVGAGESSSSSSGSPAPSPAPGGSPPTTPGPSPSTITTTTTVDGKVQTVTQVIPGTAPASKESGAPALVIALPLFALLAWASRRRI